MNDVPMRFAQDAFGGLTPHVMPHLDSLRGIVLLQQPESLPQYLAG